MKPIYITSACIFMMITTINAQHPDNCGYGHDHSHDVSRKAVSLPEIHGHHHDRNEIGISAGGIYGTDHKEWGSGFHIHYFRTLRENSRWAAGAFAEQVWLDHTHFSAGAGVRFEPVDRLGLGVFPGITFARHKGDHDGHTHQEGWKTRFSMHFEVVYDLFHWKHFHLGPVADYSWSKDDSHLMLGLHGAFCF